MTRKRKRKGGGGKSGAPRVVSAVGVMKGGTTPPLPTHEIKNKRAIQIRRPP